MAVYFAKEIVSNRFLIEGKPVDFEVLDGNMGVIKVEETEDNKTLIQNLNKAIGRFGIYKISEQEYTEKKTAPRSGPSPSRLRLNEKLRVLPTRQPTNPFARRAADAAADELGAQRAATPPEPRTVAPLEPSPFVKANQTGLPETHVPGAAEAAAEAAKAAASAPPANDAAAADGEKAAPKFTPAVRRISRRTEGEPAAG